MKPRKMNKAELESMNSRLDLQNTVLMQALNALVNNRVERILSYEEPDGAAWIYSVTDLGRAHGGLFLTTFRCEGQSDSLSVAYLDDLISAHAKAYGVWTPYAAAEREALSYASGMRYRILFPSAS